MMDFFPTRDGVALGEDAAKTLTDLAEAGRYDDFFVLGGMLGVSREWMIRTWDAAGRNGPTTRLVHGRPHDAKMAEDHE